MSYIFFLYKKIFIIILFFLITKNILAIEINQNNNDIHNNENEIIYIIDNNYLSKSYNHRINTIVLHYTVLDLEKSIKVLTQKNVSSHYLIPDQILDHQNKILYLVPENLRAWHAGESYWKTKTNINDTSIGIEIVNFGYKIFNKKKYWFPFNDFQIQSLIFLIQNIINKYNILPINIIGHSDIAIGRKFDPGPLFPWEKLFHYGIGTWYDENEVKLIKNHIKKNKIYILNLQQDLQKYGYNIELTGVLDKQTKNVIKTFQMHFRQKNFSGKIDYETIAILQSLLNKYKY